MNREAAFVIHHLKTPLASLEFLAQEAVHDARAGKDTTEHLERIHHRLRLLRSELSALNSAAELSSDRQLSVNLRSVPISEIATMAEKHLADFSASPKRGKITHKLSLQRSLRLRSAVADLECLDQVFHAVLSNAFGYAYGGSCVTVRFQAVLSHGLEISISNKGLPLRAEDIPKVFQRGWRSPTAAATTVAGDGTGLWLAQSLLKAMNGQIHLLPTNAQAITTALIHLPLSP